MERHNVMTDFNHTLSPFYLRHGGWRWVQGHTSAAGFQACWFHPSNAPLKEAPYTSSNFCIATPKNDASSCAVTNWTIPNVTDEERVILCDWEWCVKCCRSATKGVSDYPELYPACSGYVGRECLHPYFSGVPTKQVSCGWGSFHFSSCSPLLIWRQ